LNFEFEFLTGATRVMFFLDNRKYRTILVSALLFLTFDLGVLLPNFIISARLKDSAIAINLAGRQRMLSQRMVKALLQIKTQQEQGKNPTASQAELALTFDLFDRTLQGFADGKTVIGGDGKPVFLPPVRGEMARSLVDRAIVIWQPYAQQLHPLLTTRPPLNTLQVEAAITHALDRNLQLLEVMNQLTSELQHQADREATLLQLCQTIGMLLALTNFGVLLSHSLRKLKAGDVELVRAHAQIQALNQQLAAENLRLGAELDVTRRLQQMLLPREEELLKVAGLDISGFMEPATEVGGDYYDVLTCGESVKIGIGDVVGHGLESGVLTLMVQTAVRTLLENHETDPRQFMAAVNRTIHNNLQRMNCDRNVTLCLLDYHHNGKLLISGQHEELIVVRSTGEVERIDTIDLGFPVGIVADIGEFVSQIDIQLHPDDVVVLYTDGITEAENDRGKLYGVDRLCHVICHHRHQSADRIRLAIVEDWRLYIGDRPIDDDITLLVLKQKQSVG
jgi:phosphoserine phosphatase RsbU/P